MTSFRESWNDQLQLTNQDRQILLDDLPHDIAIDFVITVYQSIAQCHDLRPSDVWILIAGGG